MSTKRNGPQSAFIALLFFTATLCSIGEAQSTPSPDSLLAYWVKRGALANWQPHELFKGCPNLQPWQRRGTELLFNADLPREREGDLAGALAIPLKVCRDTRVERWYFGHVEAAARRGESEGATLKYWMALEAADSPAIRRFLRDMMLDVRWPEHYRNSAGAAFFGRLTPEERFDEYTSAFETMRLPEEVAWGQTESLGKDYPDRLGHRIGMLVRANPELAGQTAFAHLVQSVSRRMSIAGRADLKSVVRSGLSRPGLSEQTRVELERSNAILGGRAE